MKAYIITFIICLLLCIVSDLFFNKKRFKMSKIFLLFSILVLCTLAALRSEYTGRDVHNYLTMLFRDFSSGISLFDEIKSVRAGGIEPLFMLLVLVFSKFNNLNIVFFFVQLAIVLPIFIFSYEYKKEKQVPITLTIFIFLMTMYVYSFSMMRQSIAIAIGLLTLFYYMKDKKKISYILLAISFLFHRTAIIVVVILFLYNCIFKNKLNKYMYLFIVLVIGLVVGLLLPYIVSLLPSKYSLYLGSQYETSFNYFSLLKKMTLFFSALLLTIGSIDKNSDENKLILFSLFIIIYDIMFYVFGLRVPEISRICLYFTNISYFIFIPILTNRIKPKIIGEVFVVALLFFLWHRMTTGNNEADIYPYRSDIAPYLNDLGV